MGGEGDWLPESAAYQARTLTPLSLHARAEGMYDSGRRRRVQVPRHSMSDPSDYFLQVRSGGLIGLWCEGGLRGGISRCPLRMHACPCDTTCPRVAGSMWPSVVRRGAAVQNSLAGDSNYQVPPSLRASPRRGQGFGAARPRPVMQRIIAVSRTSMREPEPLHDSYSAVDYAEQTGKKKKA